MTRITCDGNSSSSSKSVVFLVQAASPFRSSVSIVIMSGASSTGVSRPTYAYAPDAQMWGGRKRKASHVCSPEEAHDRISKDIGRILRYNTAQYGLVEDSEGFVLFDDLLPLRELYGFTREQILRVVHSSARQGRQRFELREVWIKTECKSEIPPCSDAIRGSDLGLEHVNSIASTTRLPKWSSLSLAGGLRTHHF